MDEGFNTFIDVYELDEFNHGEYAPKRDSEYAPHGGNPVDEILPVLADPDAPPILSRADTVIEKYRHPVTYFKSALGLVLLREQILGPERFDPAFRAFIAAWAFKHPTPADFFRFMDSETRRGSRLLVARLVCQQLAARPCRHRHQAVPGRRSGQGARSSRSSPAISWSCPSRFASLSPTERAATCAFLPKRGSGRHRRTYRSSARHRWCAPSSIPITSFRTATGPTTRSRSGKLGYQRR